MKHLISTKSLAAIAIALGTLTAAASAHAHSDVYFSIGVQVPGFYVQAAPVPVYVQPAPFYRPAPIYYQRHDNGRHRHHGRHWQQRGPYAYPDRDRDDDGVRNRYDRFPDNPYRR